MSKLREVLNEASSSNRMPIESVAKKVGKLDKTAEKIENDMAAASDKLTAKLNKEGFSDEALEVETLLLEVADKANELWRAIKKAEKELYQIGSRF